MSVCCGSRSGLLNDFLVALGMVFVAEMGDRTQLVALCFATRFNARVVLSGIFAATLVVHVFSVLIGKFGAEFIPTAWVNLTSGIAFIGFGAWTLCGDDVDDESCNNRQGRSPFWIVASTFFIAELGDKTMLTTIVLAAKYPQLPVWLGSTMGMVAADGAAIMVGRLMGKRLPERAIKVGASVIFFVFGAMHAVQGMNGLAADGLLATGCAASVCVLGAFAVGLARKRRTPARRAEIPPKENVRELTSRGPRG